MKIMPVIIPIIAILVISLNNYSLSLSAISLFLISSFDSFNIPIPFLKENLNSWFSSSFRLQSNFFFFDDFLLFLYLDETFEDVRSILSFFFPYTSLTVIVTPFFFSISSSPESNYDSSSSDFSSSIESCRPIFFLIL